MADSRFAIHDGSSGSQKDDSPVTWFLSVAPRASAASTMFYFLLSSFTLLTIPPTPKSIHDSFAAVGSADSGTPNLPTHKA